ncbi:MAG: lipoyl(octanoyl) transferase LipB [candidate division KSB1 bacterium]|jgi:lipoate-protein ligase B|nr:lipoyl(octanoyl) transferase LipB [candidate division KSB1 bacterium]
METTNEKTCVVLNIGRQSIADADSVMTRLADLRYAEQIPDVLLLLSHPPGLSIGARPLNRSDLLMPLDFFTGKGIGLHQSERGGGLTYHWPGQLICYPVMKLAAHEKNIPQYMDRLEEVAIRTLYAFGVQAHRKREETAQIGLWVGDRKIASMGISISRWITRYGFALNLYGDLSPSRYIRPCGLKDVSLTSIEQLTGITVDREEVAGKLIGHFRDVFNRHMILDRGRFGGYPGDSDTDSIMRVISVFSNEINFEKIDEELV